MVILLVNAYSNHINYFWLCFKIKGIQVQEKYNSRVYNDIFSMYIRFVHLYVLMISFSAPLLKKDSIVDTISAMEFCFLYGKHPIFALLPLISAFLMAFFLLETRNPPSSAPERQIWRILYRSRIQSFKESICATSINIIMCINLIICSLAFFQEIVPNSALRLYFAYIPHEMHEDLLSRQQ